jgi:hypothetical protein
MKKFAALAVVAMFAMVIGCAITDYNGWADHKSTSEAKLWGKDVSFSGFTPPDLNGTYSYTAKYDNTAEFSVTINSYKNEAISSFTRDGMIDMDGDDVQGSQGTNGGRFLPFFKAVDTDPFGCGFSDNIVFDKSSAGYGAGLCFTGGGMEEVDKDFELHAAFTDLDHFNKSIWTGVTGDPFAVDVAAIRINQNNHWVSTFPIEMSHNFVRARTFTIHNGPGLQSAIKAILDNTEHLVPVQFGFVAVGGMTVDTPVPMQVAFNHDSLRAHLDTGAPQQGLSPKFF